MRPLVLLPAALALAARLITGPHPIDDAFITFRYARNLAEGLGLVYNPGEWVLGTTTPVWALLLALGYRLGLHDLALVASVFAAVCDAASAALIAGLALRLGWGLLGAVLVGSAWAINPMSIAFAAGGMETSLFVLLALVTLALACAGRVWTAALLAGASVFVRPEALLLVVVVLGWTWLTRRRLMGASVVAAGAPVLLGGALIALRYGSPLPASMAAKQVAYVAPGPVENAAAMLLQAGLPGWSPFLLSVMPAVAGVLIAASGLVTLAVLARRGLSASSARWQPFAAFGALYVVCYALAGVRGVRLFPWYLVPLVPLYLLGASAGLARLGPLVRPALAGLLVVWQLPAIDWTQSLLPVGYHLDREAAMLSVGQQLATELPPDAVVAAPEIGALGYASGLRILDTVGLISPSALAYYPLPAKQLAADNAIPPRLIEDQRPDAVVTLDAYARQSLLTDGAFERDYAFERSYPVEVWNSSELLVFRRRDAH